MFSLRRSSEPAADAPDAPTSASSTTPEGPVTADGTAPARTAPKGRPTPTRKEAEAAARERARAPRTRKEVAAAKRQARAAENQRVRAAMRTGDERHLLPRDQGPVRRFVREWVDSRFSFLEIVLPVVLVATVCTYSGNPTLVSFGSTVMLAVVLLLLVDILILRIRLRAQLAARFPDEKARGTTWYAVSRSMQMRFMRLPKTQVKIGQELPERYR